MPLTNIALSYSNYAGGAKHPVGIEWCGGGGWHGKHVERTLLPFQSKVSLSSTLSWMWLTLVWNSRPWLIYHLNLFTWTLVVDGFQPEDNFGLIPSECSTFPSGLGGGALKMSWLAGGPKWRELKLKWEAGYKREKGAYIYMAGISRSTPSSHAFTHNFESCNIQVKRVPFQCAIFSFLSDFPYLEILDLKH